MGFAVNSFVDGVASIELLTLRLSKVANLHIVPELECAGVVVDFSHNALDKGRFTRTILPDKGDFLPTLNSHIHIGEDGMRTVALGEAIDDHGISTRSHCRQEGEMHRRAVNILYFDAVDLGELLDAALYLYGLRRLVSEAFDEVFGSLDFLLLVLISAALLLESLFTKDKVMAVVRLVVVQSSHLDLQRAVRRRIDKSTVVRDEHQGRRARSDEAFQPTNGLDIQMVCGLVKQEHIGSLKKDLSQFDTHTPST